MQLELHSFSIVLIIPMLLCPCTMQLAVDAMMMMMMMMYCAITEHKQQTFEFNVLVQKVP